MIGREWGGAERRRETVDLPVAREPVRPRSIIVGVQGWALGLVGMLVIGGRVLGVDVGRWHGWIVGHGCFEVDGAHLQ